MEWGVIFFFLGGGGGGIIREIFVRTEAKRTRDLQTKGLKESSSCSTSIEARIYRSIDLRPLTMMNTIGRKEGRKDRTVKMCSYL